MYHAGASDDVFECLKTVKKEHPDSNIVLAGFSMGGNIVLKLAGELGTLAKTFLTGVISISPPVDFYESVERLGREPNTVYERYFYRTLRADVYYRHRKFKLAPVKLPKKMRVYEFDQLYTAPQLGFSNVMDYYNKCSSSHVVEDIAIPCKILLAEDDPIIPSTSLDHYKFPSNITVYKTKKGGHLGYLGKTDGGKSFYWLDSKLIDWIMEF
jgi:hypothetical protein